MSTNPPWLDTGDNAWQLTAASLVALQSVPGLVILYAGMVKHKWAINSAFMAFYAFAAVLISWVVWAYKAAFGVQMLPFVGYPGPAVTIDYEIGQALLPTSGAAPNFPMATMVYFQFVFAAITLIILAGALLGRMNFLAWMLFVPLWLTFSYTVGAFSLWGGGFLAVMGVIDYSGGYVIHLSSGTAGFVAAYWVGPRLAEDREDNRPNNVLLVMVGAGILWIGWNGFNGGDPYAANADAGVAVLNTNVCTAMSMLVWTGCDMLYFKKASIIGSVQGMITGLVAITPAAGVISGWAAIALAVGSGSIPWFTMNIVGRRYAFMQRVDDTLGVFHTHFVASLVGGIGTGLYATTIGCAAFGSTAYGVPIPGGAIEGNGRQVWVQIVGALFIFGWNVVWTSLILLFIKHVLRVPLRMSEADLRIGDYAIHGEEPYVFGDMHRSLVHGDTAKARDVESGAANAVIIGREPEGSADRIESVHGKGSGSGSRDIEKED
jgi:Amt family ammonium transporter